MIRGRLNGGIEVGVRVRVGVVAVVVIGVRIVIGGRGRGTSDQDPVQATNHHLAHPREKVLPTDPEGHHLQNVTNEDDEKT